MSDAVKENVLVFYANDAMHPYKGIVNETKQKHLITKHLHAAMELPSIFCFVIRFYAYVMANVLFSACSPFKIQILTRRQRERNLN